jgi:hypothetical protein
LRVIFLFLAICQLLLISGCSLNRQAWSGPAYAAPIDLTTQQTLATGFRPAEWYYCQAVALEQSRRAECVDYYYQAAVGSWPAVEAGGYGTEQSRDWQLHHSAIARMLEAAQQLGRWRRGVGLMVNGPAGLKPVPTIYHGFAWNSRSFTELAPVGEYEVPRLRYQYRSEGLGVPLVVVRRGPCIEPFMKDEQSFAATAVLRPASVSASGSPESSRQANQFALELFNPLLVDSLPAASGRVPLASDLSAPFAYPPRGKDTLWLQDFLVPGSGTINGGLYMIEPYQPGHIPVVLIHGLLSDARTWINMANQLRANREIANRYQLWAFQYSTGTQFFESAAVLRRELRRLRETYDPHRKDPAFSQTVLVGHSMGGLVAKLQVTYSGERLWNTLANRPLQQITTTPQTRERLLDQLFFDPSPDIARVIFIGTPHQGSSDATRCIGRIGSALAKQSPESKLGHDQMVRDNPGVFNSAFQRKIPSSIDLLEPENPFLRTMLTLPFAPSVRVHSICGDIERTCIHGPSDGKVPLASARLVGVCSEVVVPVKHTELTHDTRTINEVVRILCQHAQCK